MNRLTKLATILLITNGVTSGAFAADTTEHRRENDAVTVTTAKLSMDDALKTALATIPGKPTLARLENDNGQDQWRIEIVATQGVFDINIDANTGRILHQAMDKPDHAEEAED